MPFVTTKTLKLKTGLSLPTIRAALKAANIEADTGKFDEVSALAALAAQVDPARTAGHAAAGLGDVSSKPISAYADARANSERMRARKLELEILSRSGELVDREQVKQIGTSLITSARIALLAVPSKVAPKLLDIKNALDAQRIVDQAIRDALGDLADELKFVAEVLS
jgi:hypothetical protein